MDIARAPRPKRRKWIAAGGGILALVGLTVAVGRLEPAAPTVERSTLWVDSVRRGTMVRQVRAPGTLVPERIRWVAALTAGRVERIPVRPGVAVKSEDVIIELSNPDVQLELLEAEQQLANAQAQLVNLKTSLESQRLNQEATVASVRTEAREAARNAELARELDKRGLTAKDEVERTGDRVTELEQRTELERQRLEIMTRATKDQYALQAGQVERLRDIAEFQRRRVRSMQVAAGESGVVQELPLELGQWVVPGQLLARVAQPGRLKAVLRVPETQAKDVALGQTVSIDTRNGVVPGKVMRIDPAAQGGTVTVEVALEGDLPKGARAELSVDGTIEIERLTDVLYVGRPAYGQPESDVELFRLSPDGSEASRVTVSLGRSSVNTIEVVKGLNPGDRVIISDVTQFDGQSRLRIR